MAYTRRLACSFLAVLVLLALVPGAARAASDIRLSGAGATFPAPLYNRWVVEFEKAQPRIKISYTSIGSGGGIKAVTDRTASFGASDAPLTRKELEALGGADAVLQFPLAAGAVVPAYNLPGVTTPVRFTGEVLAKIFLGSISKWNDPALTALNPDLKLPDLAITPVYRTEGSGTTFVFASYLAGQSDDFKSTVGVGKQVRWPLGRGGKGNEGVAAAVQQTPGAIGYIESNYATANKIAFGPVRNTEGEFVTASPSSIAAAGTAAVASFKDSTLTADIWNQPGKGAYPISAFTYIILRKDLSTVKTAEEAGALLGFFRWALTDGQTLAETLDYAPLAEPVRAKVRTALDALTFHGKPVPAPGQ